jgi:hypothetical protein
MFAKLLNAFAVPAGVKGLLAAAVIGISPTAALARHHDFHVDFDFHGGRPHVEIVDVPPPPPAYEQREVRVWIDPVYRTVSDRQWVAPEYRTVVDRVWVPEQYGFRNTMYFDHGRRCISRERVLIQPGYYQDVSRQELVCEGRWQSVERQELVSPGHWETRLETVAANRAQYPE